MRVLAAAAISALLVSPVSAQTKEEMREMAANVYANSFYKGCLRDQRAAYQNAELSDETIRRFCGCLAQRLPEIVPIEELTHPKDPKNWFRNMRKQMNDAAATCADKVIPR